MESKTNFLKQFGSYMNHLLGPYLDSKLNSLLFILLPFVSSVLVYFLFKTQESTLDFGNYTGIHYYTEESNKLIYPFSKYLEYSKGNPVNSFKNNPGKNILIGDDENGLRQSIPEFFEESELFENLADWD